MANRAGVLDLDTELPQQVRADSYLVFRLVPTSKTTRHWMVWSTRCFVFEPYDETVFNSGCMTDLAAFCDAATEQWRKEVKSRGA